MCKHGTTIDVEVTVPAGLSHTGERRTAVKPIDACLAPAIRRLNALGIVTVNSCCGHGKTGGSVVLEEPSPHGRDVDARLLRQRAVAFTDGALMLAYGPVDKAMGRPVAGGADDYVFRVPGLRIK